MKLSYINGHVGRYLKKPCLFCRIWKSFGELFMRLGISSGYSTWCQTFWYCHTCDKVTDNFEKILRCRERGHSILVEQIEK